MKYKLLTLLSLAILFYSCVKKQDQAPESTAFLVIDDVFLQLIDTTEVLQKVESGFQFTEGPAWSHKNYLLFSDIPASRIYQWSEEEGLRVYQEPSFNANGLAITSAGALLICEHGNRLLRLVTEAGEEEVLANQYKGLRLNSPNDLSIKSDGSIYFTDPPYGLSLQDDDPEKELSFNGIYRYKNEELILLDSSMIRPNGIAFSPDEKYLYVAQSEIDPKWMRFSLDGDGNIIDENLFFDAAQLTGRGTPDGLKVDEHGNLFCSGPGGIVVISPEGKHLGTILTPEVSTNCAFGGADGKTLFITAQTSVYAIRLKVRGFSY